MTNRSTVVGLVLGCLIALTTLSSASADLLKPLEVNAIPAAPPAPTEEAVATAFGISLKELTEQFEGGAWRKDASYRLPAPAKPPPSVATPVELDAAAAEGLLKVLKERVVEFAAR